MYLMQFLDLGLSYGGFKLPVAAYLFVIRAARAFLCGPSQPRFCRRDHFPLHTCHQILWNNLQEMLWQEQLHETAVD